MFQRSLTVKNANIADDESILSAQWKGRESEQDYNCKTSRARDSEHRNLILKAVPLLTPRDSEGLNYGSG